MLISFAPPDAHCCATGFSYVPSEDSEAEEDLLTLKARSESLSSGPLLGEPLGDMERGEDWRVPAARGRNEECWRVLRLDNKQRSIELSCSVCR